MQVLVCLPYSVLQKERVREKEKPRLEATHGVGSWRCQPRALSRGTECHTYYTGAEEAA